MTLCVDASRSGEPNLLVDDNKLLQKKDEQHRTI